MKTSSSAKAERRRDVVDHFKQQIFGYKRRLRQPFVLCKAGELFSYKFIAQFSYRNILSDFFSTEIHFFAKR